MSDEVRQRLFFDLPNAFNHPLTTVIVILVAVGLAAGPWIFTQLYRRGLISGEMRGELYERWKGWCWIAPAIIVPILLGVFWTILGVFILSLVCFHEYARTTGLFREKTICFCAIAGIVLVAFASLDGFPRLFFATAPLTVAVIAASTLQSDRPTGYIQRVALGVFGFLLFGYSLGYLGQFAAMENIIGDVDYRPILLLILLGVSINDVFAYCVGKSMGRKKLLPNTSPGKTVAGSVGALVLTTLLVAFFGHFVFDGTAMDNFWRLLTLGFIISGLGQLGDLILSSIKRDVGVKDTGRLIPGHGGMLDRFNSLLLVPPAVYHYLSLNLGPLGVFDYRIFTGG